MSILKGEGEYLCDQNVPSYHAPVWDGPGENAILFRGNQSLHGTQASAEEWNTRIFTMTVDAAFRGGGKKQPVHTCVAISKFTFLELHRSH